MIKTNNLLLRLSIVLIVAVAAALLMANPVEAG